MGTRHFQKVINKEGEVKIAQYGQWDGYPDGQGKEILEYLKSGDLTKYQSELNRVPLINDEQLKLVDKTPDWTKVYPYLSRDCGSQIHKMIEDGEVKFVAHTDDDEAGKWCEGFYTIDFKENVFISEFHGQHTVYPLDNLPSEEDYLADMKKSDPDYEADEEDSSDSAMGFESETENLEALITKLENILIQNEEEDGDRLPDKIAEKISEAIGLAEELTETLATIGASSVYGVDEEE